MKTETMFSRERVIKVLNREPVDRFPIDLGSHYSTGISLFAYWHLREYLGLSTDNIRSTGCVPQLIAQVEPDVLERFHCDCAVLHPGWEHTFRWNPRDHFEFTMPRGMNPKPTGDGGWLVEDGERRMRFPTGGHFFDGDWIDGFFECDDDVLLKRMAQYAEHLYKETPYATNFIWRYGGYAGNLDRQMRMLTEPDDLLKENEVTLQWSIDSVGKAIDLMGEHVQLVTINDDMGTQTGPMSNPATLEQFSMPFIKRFTDFVHANSDWKVFHHCCGSIKPLIPMLIEAGVDVLNPVQISADNMDPQELKREFGEDIIFWGGGCDTQNVLGFTDVPTVEANVEKLVNIFKPGGGFVFNPVHNILGNVPPEQIIAAYDKAYELAFYE